MAILDTSTAAKLLILQHGVHARTYADCQALEEFLCGDQESSEDWEQVGLAVEALLGNYPKPHRAA